jgi:NADH:ubiquinone reductase (H+-translocating)
MGTTTPGPSSAEPVVVLGGGYAGLKVAQDVSRLTRGKLPVLLIDRNSVHTLRTELYEIGQLARAGTDPKRWTIPLARVLDRTSVSVRQGELRSIDLVGRSVGLDSGTVAYGSLAICLGSVAAHYGVPGAAENTHSVYRLSGAQRLAAAILEVERRSGSLPRERHPRIVIVGGGSTGTELAAEIAAFDWRSIAGPDARSPEVVLLTGAVPFLAGFDAAVVARARQILRRRGVLLFEGLNVTRVDPGRISVSDGTQLTFDIAVWCAGLEAPPVVKSLPVPHGRAGRIAVEPTLEVPGFPGVFAVGDVIELVDPETHVPVPGTAAAALAAAAVAARNIVAQRSGKPLEPFRYRERGVLVALGPGSGAGAVRHVTIWGSPAALLKRLVQRDYAASVERGGPPHLAG